MSSELQDLGIRDDGILCHANPAEFVCFFDPVLREGQAALHKWQLNRLTKLGAVHPTDQEPYKFCLCAANGSGKDRFIVAPFAVWFLCTKPSSRCIITSSSGTQLSSQTELYIVNLANKVNALYNEIFGCDYLEIKQRHIRCPKLNSEIRLFATDEAGRAEGYHPLEPGAEMAIIVNECKTVDESIFTALENCTGYNYWLEVSTPGPPSGHFYYAFTHWENVERITAYDCEHISRALIEADKKRLGEASPIYRSRRLALFTSVDTLSVVSVESFDRCKSTATRLDNWFKWNKRVGIDLALGGDETVITITQGNCRVYVEGFRETDGTRVASRINEILKKNGIAKDSPYINADDGGLGRPILDMLETTYGWKINRVLFQSPAFDSDHYGNRGAELWHRFARMVEEGVFYVTDFDEETTVQLVSRKFRDRAAISKPYLQAKKEARSEGLKSPDRADSLVLSLFGLQYTDFLHAEPSDKQAQPTKIHKTNLRDLASVASLQDHPSLATSGRCNGSISSALSMAPTRSGERLQPVDKQNLYAKPNISIRGRNLRLRDFIQS